MRQKLTVTIIILLLSSCLVKSQTKSVPFSDENWDLSSAKKVTHLNKDAVMGTAYLNDVNLQEGIIEVDIATKSRSRSYPGVLFRMANKYNYERVYIRPHRSPFYDDALQYAPTFNAVDSWQLYSGIGNTASIDIQPDVWNYLKIIFSKNKLRFIGMINLNRLW